LIAIFKAKFQLVSGSFGTPVIILLPQGRVEAARRAKAMVAKMDELGFGNCTNTRACEMECPKNVSVSNIARLNREFLKAKLQD
jgi:succinate dehydrogenase / fumarate reductase, iron-sulfur subunit